MVSRILITASNSDRYYTEVLVVFLVVRERPVIAWLNHRKTNREEAAKGESGCVLCCFAEMPNSSRVALAVVLACCAAITRRFPAAVVALSTTTNTVGRRAALGWIATGGAAAGWISLPEEAAAEAGADTRPDSFDVDRYLKEGFALNPMGVSGQAGE